MRLGERTIAEFVRLPVTEAVAAFAALVFEEREQPVARAAVAGDPVRACASSTPWAWDT